MYENKVNKQRDRAKCGGVPYIVGSLKPETVVGK